MANKSNKMSASDLQLFVKHLGQIIAEKSEDALLDEVRDLLRVHLAKSDSRDTFERLATDIAGCVCAVLSRQRAAAVRAIINSLSFSELEAAAHFIKQLGEKNEGILIAGHIADRLGFARSVVTSALRKLEGANLIEARSLGMKGTYIRVKDSLLREEFDKKLFFN